MMTKEWQTLTMTVMMTWVSTDSEYWFYILFINELCLSISLIFCIQEEYTIRIVYHNNKKVGLFYRCKSVFNCIISLFFIFSPHYIKYFALFCIYYITHAHIDKISDSVLHQFNIRQEEEEDDNIVLVFSFILSHPPTH